MAENQERTDEEILKALDLELDEDESTPDKSNDIDAKEINEEPNELSELEALVNGELEEEKEKLQEMRLLI